MTRKEAEDALAFLGQALDAMISARGVLRGTSLEERRLKIEDNIVDMRVSLRNLISAHEFEVT